jgi:membrane-associated protease RseP (regulator of RpoE activity)
MSKDRYRVSDELWEKIVPLLPKHVNTHRFGGGRPRADDRQCLNGILFVLTLVSTFAIGVLLSVSFVYPDSSGPSAAPRPSVGHILEPRILLLAGLYAAVLMIILTGHELGHYLTCRHYGIAATLPYFIPGPTLIGTFGAFIRIQSPVSLKRQWFDIGAAGPLAGFILTLPALFVGLALSKIVPVAASEGAVALGEPLLLKLGSALFFRHVPAGSDVVLHPVAFAGWIGLLVTAMNLIPIGQLDGGHVLYSLLLRKRRYLYVPIFGALIALGLLWIGWLIWVLIAFFIARRDPLIQDAVTPLSAREKALAFIPLAVLILTFVPQPFVVW